jgi:hypothetical protein
MKVRITKCNIISYWYYGKVGEIFNVQIHDDENYRVINSVECIRINDCEIIGATDDSIIVSGNDKHYNNDKGSLYLFAEQHDLNAWEFDIIKRIVRCRKKGQFTEDLEKTKRVIDLYLKEYHSKADSES